MASYWNAQTPILQILKFKAFLHPRITALRSPRITVAELLHMINSLWWLIALFSLACVSLYNSQIIWRVALRTPHTSSDPLSTGKDTTLSAISTVRTSSASDVVIQRMYFRTTATLSTPNVNGGLPTNTFSCKASTDKSPLTRSSSRRRTAAVTNMRHSRGMPPAAQVRTSKTTDNFTHSFDYWCWNKSA